MSQSETFMIPVGPLTVEGDLTLPDSARGLVIFAHGSGSSRKSPRNRFIATRLNEGGFATLLFDLLTPAEEAVDATTREYRFNIPLLALRLECATQWVTQINTLSSLPIGYFGASTGAAAALVAAAETPKFVQAVVSRGGRPDLAEDSLELVRCPTLLIVGSADREVLELNETALERVPSHEKRLEKISGATHLFEEPGTLERAADIALDWFDRYLTAARLAQRAARRLERRVS